LYEFSPAPASLRLLKNIVDDRIPGGAYLGFDGEGKRLFLHGWGERLSVFDVATGRLVVATPPTPASFLRTIFRVDRAGRWAFPAATETSPPQPAAWSVDDGRCRQVLTPIDTRFESDNLAVHPSGRLATGSGGTGGRLVIYDLDVGRVVGGFSIPGDSEPPFTAFDEQGRWLVNSYKGFWRWPVTFDAADPRSVVIGPPERLPFQPGNRRVDSDRSGTVFSQMMWNGYGMAPYAGVWLFRADRGGPAERLLKSPDTWDARVSPDGRWVAVQAEGMASVFDSRSGKRAWTAPRGLRLLSFTPDGQWLALGDDGITYVPVGSWGPARRVGPGAFQRFSGFSRDGTTAAVASAKGDVSLIETATGRVLLTLRDRGREDSPRSEILLTPDGSKLLLSHPDGLEVWDLARVRAGLAEMGLDWDAPTLPAASDRTPAPLRVRFVGLDKLAHDSRPELPAPKSSSP
jgi:WD40 repeat protein